jgi:hypothetical protein
MMEVPFGWRRGVSDGYYGPDLSITTSVLLGYMWKQGLKAVSDAIAGAFPSFFNDSFRLAHLGTMMYIVVVGGEP